jgi:hypothetical protein
LEQAPEYRILIAEYRIQRPQLIPIFVSMPANRNSVEEVIASLPKEERIICQYLRKLILDNIQPITEKNNYGAPFYVRNRMMFFIWPPSLYWGSRKLHYAAKGVTLGFCQGNKMKDDQGLLLAEGRKQVYCMYFKTLKETDEAEILPLLFEADEIDRGFRKKK